MEDACLPTECASPQNTNQTKSETLQLKSQLHLLLGIVLNLKPHKLSFLLLNQSFNSQYYVL